MQSNTNFCLRATVTLRHMYSCRLEEPERGANMIIAFATCQKMHLPAFVDYLDNLDDDDIDVEMTPEIADKYFGLKGTTVGFDRKQDLRKWKSMGRAIE